VNERLELDTLLAAILEARDKVAALPYRIEFQVDQAAAHLVMLGSFTVGTVTHSSVARRPLHAVLTSPSFEFTAMFGHIDNSLGRLVRH
jgi:hypothetical protein